MKKTIDKLFSTLVEEAKKKNEGDYESIGIFLVNTDLPDEPVEISIGPGFIWLSDVDSVYIKEDYDTGMTGVFSYKDISRIRSM